MGALGCALFAGAIPPPALAQALPPEDLRGSVLQEDASQQDAYRRDPKTRAPAPDGSDPYRFRGSADPEAEFVDADPLAIPEERPDERTATTLQGTAPATSIAEPGEPPPIRPITPVRQRPEDLDPYAPVGMPLGSFRFFPEIQVGSVFTDNVLSTRTDRHSDAGLELIPRFRLQSDWNRHALLAEFNADRVFYNEFSSENVDNWQALVRGRIDVQRRTFLDLEAAMSQTREGRNAAQLPDAALAREDLREQHATAALSHTFNRLTLRLSQTFAEYDYSDVELPDGDTFVGDVRDYKEALTILRGTYEFQPGVAAIVETSVNDRDFRQPFDGAGNRKGSSGYSVQGGMSVRVGPTLTGEVTAGFAKQNPDEGVLQEVEAFILNADLTWQPTALTKVRFDARSSIDETTVVDASGAISRFYQLSIEHALRRNFILGAFVNYETADYVGDPLFEQRWRYGATAEYLLSRELAILARYEHTDFISTSPASDYKENEFKLGMRLRR